MVNKNFKKELKIYAEANLLSSNHFQLSIDTHWLALDIAIAPKLKMLRIQVLCIIIDIF